MIDDLFAGLKYLQSSYHNCVTLSHECEGRTKSKRRSRTPEWSLLHLELEPHSRVPRCPVNQPHSL